MLYCKALWPKRCLLANVFLICHIYLNTLYNNAPRCFCYRPMKAKGRIGGFRPWHLLCLLVTASFMYRKKTFMQNKYGSNRRWKKWKKKLDFQRWKAKRFSDADDESRTLSEYKYHSKPSNDASQTIFWWLSNMDL